MDSGVGGKGIASSSVARSFLYLHKEGGGGGGGVGGQEKFIKHLAGMDVAFSEDGGTSRVLASALPLLPICLWSRCPQVFQEAARDKSS